MIEETKIVLFPTLRQARYKWSELIQKYPSFWAFGTTNPITLTSISGTKYVFHVGNEGSRKLKGIRSEIMCVDDFIGEVENDNQNLA